jgi:hypothetical protein
MTLELIGIIAIVVAIIGIFSDPAFIVTAFLCATLLGSAAAFILEAVGGLNISPAHFLLGFVAIKLLSDRQVARNTLQAMLPGRPGFWLLLTVAYALLSAFFMPRLFSGETFVFPVRITESMVTYPLQPAMSNLTQSIYLVADFACFVLLSGYASLASGRRVLADAALACVFLNLVFVVLDLVTFWTGTGELLSFVRNANYSLMSESEVSGLKRIVGSFVEASSFASATLGYFAYTFQLYLQGIRPRLTFTLSLLSLSSILLSTSSTGYVGVAIYLFISFAQILFRWTREPLPPRVAAVLFAAPIAFLLLVVAVSLNDTSSAYVQDLLDSTLFNKLQTSSGEERSAWNRQAIQNFVDTFGFGAGNGSARASSFPMAVLGSLGFVGVITFSLFFIGVLFGRYNSFEVRSSQQANMLAARSVCLAWLITASTSGALTDLGIPFYAFAALASAQLSPSGEVVTRRGKDAYAPLTLHRG